MSSSDENDFFYEDEYEDSGNEEGDDDEDADNDEFGMDIGLGEEQASGQDGAGIGTGSSSESDRKHGEEFAYEVLSSDQIVDSMVEAIKEVNSVMQIPATTVRVLLNHFKWDKEKLMEKYFSDSQEKMFKDAKVTSPFATMTIEASAAKDKADKSTSNSKKEATPKAQVSRECEICYLTLPKSHMTALDCSHYFCNNCWKEYLMVKIVSEGASHSIACPASECDLLVDDVRVMALLTDQKVKVKYQHLIANAFVQCNRLMRWCPAPDCPNAVKAAQVEPRPVKCKCNHTFCFSCSENWHDPVRCTLIKRWIKKCDDDSETSNWISANTKECPKCKATIEKDGGCNHMICRNIACRADFCWVCLGPWEPHGSSWYNCNRYDEDEAKEARGSQEKSRSLLQRYLFYCNRYMNHLQSLKFENKLYSMVKDKMEEMQQHNMSWIEVQFLKKAVDILCECRRTLMYTYVFAYYLQRNNQSQLFEDNQKDLENSTECLSEYLERDISAENLVDIKQKVQDKFRYCENRRKVLLEHVHEGYEKDWWEYTESDIPK